MATVLLVGTLNRVMIVELGVPSSIVAVMIALPLLVAPFRALIGFRSDTHRSALGWRRVPFMWYGSLLQFGGLAIMPFVLLVLAGNNAIATPPIVGQLGAGLAFLLVGAGLHTTQTAGLALATDLAPGDTQPRVVGLMYVMLLVGMIVSALAFGALLSPYSHERLVRVTQGAAVITLALNVVSMWKQEARDRTRLADSSTDPTFAESWRAFSNGDHAVRRLVATGLGTMAFSMQDVLLEPYGEQVLALSVSSTTLLTASLSFGGLAGFLLASRVLSRGGDAFRMASMGALIGIPGFGLVIAAAPLHLTALFFLGTLCIGFGGGLLGHGTLTATMNSAPEQQRGLALGAWGAVQASAVGLAVALGGVVRDFIAGANVPSLISGKPVATGYLVVYGIEIALLCITTVAMMPLLSRVRGRRAVAA